MPDKKVAKKPVTLRTQARLLDELLTLLDLARDAIIIRDMEGTILFWNRGAQELYGWSKEEATGKKCSDLLHTEFPVSREDTFGSLIAEGRWQGELKQTDRNGHLLAIDSRWALQKDEKGNAVAILQLSTDVSIKKQAEKVIRESELKYRLLAENVTDLVFTAGLDLNAFTYVSPSVTRLLGYAPDELSGQPLETLMPEISLEALAAIVSRFQKAAGQGPLHSSVTVEIQLRHKENILFWFDMTVSLLHDDHQAVIGLIAVGRDITERKRDLRAVQASETRYRQIVETSMEGIVIVDESGRITFANKRLAELIGFDIEELVGRSMFHFMDEEMTSLARTNIERLKQGQPMRVDFKLLRKDGQPVWTYASATPRFDSQGRYQGFLTMVTDISERKQYEEETAWLATFPKLNSNPIIEIDRSGIVFYSNPAASRLFPDLAQQGVSHPLLKGLNWIIEQISHQPGHPFVRDVEMGGMYYQEKIYAVPETGRIRIYGMDITEMRLAEKRLRMANQQLNDIIDFLPDATFVVDSKKKVIAWNRAIEELTGVNKSDMIGKSGHAYAVPFYGKPRPGLVDLVWKTDQELEAKYSYIKRKKDTLIAEVFVPQVYSGKGAFVWVKASPLYDSEGAIVGAIESVRDITEQKQAETILKQDKDAFEKLVEQRTAQLLNVQKELAVSKHLSEIGSLAATIAHELRNPLAAIRTAGFNISRKCRDRKIESHLANIEKKVLESDQIINNLLSYSRIKTPHFENVRIVEVLEECILATKARFPKWHVTIQAKHRFSKSDTIKADPLQMKELFNNLLNNAFEAFPEKKGRIIISGDLRPATGLTISFEDDGVGISADDLKKISQPFFTTKSKGTGLGLAVCHQLVSLHNGTIVFKSEKGKGTTVTVTLPSYKEQ